jgi:steroid 5-alpha reductase family enzyme
MVSSGQPAIAAFNFSNDNHSPPVALFKPLQHTAVLTAIQRFHALSVTDDILNVFQRKPALSNTQRAVLCHMKSQGIRHPNAFGFCPWIECSSIAFFARVSRWKVENVPLPIFPAA